MNRRINKKIHSRFLPDVGIELTQDRDWRKRISLLEQDESIPISRSELSESFFLLNPDALRFKLDYIVQRIDLAAVPRHESNWWTIDEETVFLVLYPSMFEEKRWYAAISFPPKL